MTETRGRDPRREPIPRALAQPAVEVAPETPELGGHERVALLPDDRTITPARATPFILIVDDHADTRDIYADCLRLAGFRTAEAENGVVAIKLARQLMPDAILLDHAMPIMDGAQAALFLKKNGPTSRIPIVMLTAFRELVRDQGRCDRYLEKPCDPRDVIDALRSLLPL